jgi:Zn finger protein HypA/HybF involved in hydrogenase expression
MAGRSRPAALVAWAMTGPRICFHPDTSDEEREAATRTLADPKARKYTRVGVHLSAPHPNAVPLNDVFSVTYSAAKFWCIDCGTKTTVWTRAHNDVDAMEAMRVSPYPCPLCHPDPPELDQAGRIALARALARTDVLDTLHVLLDQALHEGRTYEQQWHNPEDIAAIERLRFERDQLADLIAQRDEDLEAARADRTAGIRELVQQQSTLGETRWSDTRQPRRR